MFTYRDRDFLITHVPGLLYIARGSGGGHVRLFRKPLGGVVIYQWHQAESYGFSNSRCWVIPGVCAICYNDTKGGTLDHCQKPGWSIRWLRFKIERVYAGFAVSLRGPDTYVS